LRRRNYHSELINRIATHNDRIAFEILFDLYYKKLLNVAVYYLGANDYADDVVSEVFVKFLSLGSKMKQIQNPEQYFFVATKNQALNYNNKNKKYALNDNQVQLTFSVTENTPEDLMIHKEIVELIKNTVEHFPIKRKIIFQMVREENLTYQEVADQMEISIKAVEKHMHLAIQTFRNNLNNYLKSPALESSSGFK
jgi:RNA polymerase sigma-70 factor (family 1)